MVNEGEAASIDAGFSDALKMIASLPLTKAEKAEAVRRLLAGRERGKPITGRDKTVLPQFL